MARALKSQTKNKKMADQAHEDHLHKDHQIAVLLENISKEREAILNDLKMNKRTKDRILSAIDDFIKIVNLIILDEASAKVSRFSILVSILARKGILSKQIYLEK
jgi:hypothetical protein